MSAERAPYVRFFPTDWKAGVAGLPISVEWTYLQICIYNWDKGEALPEALFEIALGRNPEWKRDLSLLIDHLGKIDRTHGGSVFSARALSEASQAQDALEKRRKGGRKGAEKRWQDNGSDGSGNGSPNGTPNGSANSTPNGNQNQNQNQNQTPSNDGDPPAPQGGSGDGDAGDLIFSVPGAAMKAFREHRTKLKHPMTKRAEELVVGKLEKIWNQHGHAPADVIDQSIVEGWRGVFPLKDESNGRKQGAGRSAGSDRRDGFTRAIHGEVFPGGKPPGDD
jgi:hypothetical protein